MGEILCARRENNKIIAEVLLQDDEFRQLRGEMANICLFSDSAANVPTKISLRGRNEVTQYFLIPRQLRKKLMIQGSVSCQRFDYAGKSVFVYVLDPYSTGNRIGL
jgi:hypothetical protein